jgi:hypothetical protein
MNLKPMLLGALVMTLFTMNATHSSAAQTAGKSTKVVSVPVTVEYYYRIRWGEMDEFLRLYRKNHEPLLLEMQKQGWITHMEQIQPFTHMAGGPRWDLRITIVYRDAEAAVGVGGAFDQEIAAVTSRLFPDKAAHDAEEARRFSMLEDHWDVVVMPVSAH